MLNWINKQTEGAKILLFVTIYGGIVIPVVVLGVGISVIAIQYIERLTNPDVCNAVCCLMGS